MPIRVLLLLPTLDAGGAERTAITLARHIDRQEFDLRIGILRRQGTYLSPVDASILMTSSLGTKWSQHRSEMPLWDLLRIVPLAPIQLHQIVRRFRPHVVMSLTKGINLGACVALLAFGPRRARWIVREGNNTLAMIQGDTKNRIGRAFLRALVGRAYRMADRVLAISSGVAAGLTRDFGVPPRRLRTIYNAVDVAEVQRQAGLDDGCPMKGSFIIAAGRLSHQKGFDVLIRACAGEITRRGIGLVILGEGRERAALEALARELDVPLTLPGVVANPWAWFARAVAFTLPSRWEGFGNVVIEAMACGVPVVVSDCDFGPKEIVENGQTGLIVPVGDDRALASAILLLLDDREQAARLAAMGIERARDFDAAVVARQYEALFREVLTPGGRSALPE